MRAVRPAVTVFVCFVALLGTGCTPEPAAAPPPVPPAPTPTETDQEREQRIAYEAAEKSYREFRAEFAQVLSAGGSKEATAVMKRTAGGPYLSESVEVLRAYKGLGWKSSGRTEIVYVRPDGYSADSLVLATCEDTSADKIRDRSGKEVAKGEVREAQIVVRNSSGRWKVWSGSGKKVSSCAG